MYRYNFYVIINYRFLTTEIFMTLKCNFDCLTNVFFAYIEFNHPVVYYNVRKYRLIFLEKTDESVSIKTLLSRVVSTQRYYTIAGSPELI